MVPVGHERMLYYYIMQHQAGMEFEERNVLRDSTTF